LAMPQRGAENRCVVGEVQHLNRVKHRKNGSAAALSAIGGKLAGPRRRKRLAAKRHRRYRRGSRWFGV